MNDFQRYAATLGDLGDWRPGAVPTELPGGFDLSGSSVGRAPADAFMRESFAAVWSALPPSVRGDAVAALASLVSRFANVANVAASVIGAALQGVALVGDVLAAGNEIAAQWSAAIGATLEKNDVERRRARLELLGFVADYGARGFAGGERWTYRYARSAGSVGGKERWRHPLVWPPDYPKPKDAALPGFLRLADETNPTYASNGGECSQGASNFSGGMDGQCHGAIYLFPLFFPCWCERAFGDTNAFAGMERSSDGGAAVWSRMVAMQGALLGSPVANLMCDGARLLERLERFRWFFFGRYANPLWGADRQTSPGLYWHADANPPKGGTGPGGRTFAVAPGFEPDFPSGLGNQRFFETPGGLIGCYAPDGRGSTDHADLSRVAVRVFEPHRSSPFGGNWITARNFNTVVAACGQFFSLRLATLRSRTRMREIVEAFPELLGHVTVPATWREGGGTSTYRAIPEAAVRSAIRAVAAGSSTSPATIAAPIAAPARLVFGGAASSAQYGARGRVYGARGTAGGGPPWGFFAAAAGVSALAGGVYYGLRVRRARESER